MRQGGRDGWTTRPKGHVDGLADTRNRLDIHLDRVRQAVRGERDYTILSQCHRWLPAPAAKRCEQFVYGTSHRLEIDLAKESAGPACSAKCRVAIHATAWSTARW